MSPDQWKRAFILVRGLSQSSQQDASRSLEQLTSEDPEVIDEVRHRVANSVGLSGLRLGRYQIGDLLGHGAFGEVYRGQDTTLGRAVALKFLIPAKRKTGKLLEEAQAASALNHPNIVTVYEVLDSESGPLLVMEFIEGESLRKALVQPIPKQNADRFAVQLLEALSAAHAAGIVHRDLKPENIMVRPDGYLKVLDFGLAIQSTDSHDSGKLVGTLRYMSPEQCMGEPANAASDMFAAGLILYEMACGRHPFGNASPAETARAILREEPKAAGRSGALLRVSKGLLQKDPSKRPSAVQALKLLQVHDRWKWKAALAGLILACAVAGVWWWHARKDSTSPLVWNVMSAGTEYLTAGAISPDGSQYVFADTDGVIRQLLFRTSPAPATNTNLNELFQLSNQRVDQIAWIGRQPRLLLSSREVSAEQASGVLSILDLANRRLQKLPLAGRDAVASPDGSRIAYTSLDSLSIEIAAIDPPNVLRRVQFGDPTRIQSIFWSPSGSRLHFLTTPEQRSEPYLWKTSVLHTVDAASGRLVLEQKMPTPVLSAAMLADGRILYLSNVHSTIFELQTDTTTGRLTGKPQALGTVENLIGRLNASLDGRAIAAIVQRRFTASLHIGDLNPLTHRLENVRLLSDPAMEAYPHAWTPDNTAVIFESSYLGTQDVFRQALNQKRAERIVDMPNHQVTARVSPDGQFLLFLSGPSGASDEGLRLWDLLRMPLAGGTVEKVPGGRVQEFACQYRAARCVQREYHHGEAIFYDLDPIRGKGQVLARIKLAMPNFGDWALSPDGRKVSLVDVSRYPAAIRVIDLDHGQEQRVELEGPPPSGGSAPWSMDGQGWFLAQDPDRMMFYDLRGHPHFVYETGHWLVPSWDGRKAAFTEREREADAYLSRR